MFEIVIIILLKFTCFFFIDNASLYVKLWVMYAKQILNVALESVPKDRNGKLSKEHLRVALDVLAPSAGLPPLGAVEQVRNLSQLSLLSSPISQACSYGAAL